MDNISHQIYSEQGRELRGFIYKQVQNDFDTDDIFQELFIKIHKKIATLKDNSKINSWVYQIARNSIIDFKRKKGNIKTADDIPDLSYIAQESDEMLSHGLMVIIGTLPPIYKEILILTNYKNLSYNSISIQLGITVAAVKSRVFRARKLFKEKILEFCHFEFDSFGVVVDYEPTDCFICYLKENGENC